MMAGVSRHSGCDPLGRSALVLPNFNRSIHRKDSYSNVDFAAASPDEVLYRSSSNGNEHNGNHEAIRIPVACVAQCLFFHKIFREAVTALWHCDSTPTRFCLAGIGSWHAGPLQPPPRGPPAAWPAPASHHPPNYRFAIGMPISV